MSNDKIKSFALVSVALISAAFAVMAMPAVAQVTHIGTSPMGVYGMPDLGPLPAGVTPAYSLDTVAYLSFRPNPIGVGQTLLVNMWTSPGTHHGIYMADYKVTIQKPDGSEEVVGPLNSYLGDCTAWFELVPDQPGTYKFKFEFPGTYIPAGKYVDRPGVLTSANFTIYASMWYKPSSTDWQELTVQAEMVASWPPSALPTDYWTRPANVINREWSPILGNYPFTGGEYYYPNGRVLYASNYRYTAYVQAPNSAHIVWKRQGSLAGLIGGQTYDYAINSAPGTPSIIFAGMCYDSYTKQGSGKTAVTYWRCYDLRTGEVYWERPLESGESAPTMIEYNPPTPDPTVSGATSARGWATSLMYIGNGYLRKYNPWTGAMTLNVSVPATATLQYFGTPYAYYRMEYVLSVQDLGSSLPADQRYRLLNWTTAGTTTNFTARLKGNISWPLDRVEQADYDAGIGARVTWANPPGGEWCIGCQIWSADLSTGKLLWYYTTNNTLSENLQKADAQLVVDRGKIAFATHNRRWACWDARTGTKLWDSEQTPYPWGAWWPYSVASYDFNESKGAIITGTYEGVYAIDWDNGKLLWRYTDPNPVPFEGPYGTTPFFTGVTLADGKVYAYNGEHTPSLPYDRAWGLHCINATTGELIWKILNPMVPGAVADGYLTAANPYDGYMYVFGKGKSQTTVNVPDTVVAKGTGIVIKGTVLDMSPGQPDTPCVSQDSMTTQMQYLHLQVPIDGVWHNETIKGIPVALTAIKSDGTVIDIGATTTNGYYGTFGYEWTPPDQGKYTIMASFAGDESYGSSSAATTLSVGPAPATPEAPSQQEIVVPDHTMTIVGMGIAIMIVVAVVGILLYRKRP